MFALVFMVRVRMSEVVEVELIVCGVGRVLCVMCVDVGVAARHRRRLIACVWCGLTCALV